MPLPLIADIGRALEAFERERRDLDRQIAGLQRLLRTVQGTMAPKAVEEQVQTEKPKPTTRRGRPHMGAANRKAARDRMQAYWAKRKAQEAKRQGTRKAR